MTVTRTRVAAGAAKVVRPGRRQVKKVADMLGADDVAVVLRWVLGEVTAQDLVDYFPQVRNAVRRELAK